MKTNTTKLNTKEIITVDDFKDYQPSLASQFENGQIQDCINTATNDINAFTNFLLEKVFIANTEEPIVLPGDEMFRTDYEMKSLYSAVLSQTYFKMNMGNDTSVGDSSYSGAGVSISQSFPERNIIGNDVYQLLINARLIQVYTKDDEKKVCYNILDEFFTDPIVSNGQKPYPDPVYVPTKFTQYLQYTFLTLNKSGYVIQSKLTDIPMDDKDIGKYLYIDDNGFIAFTNALYIKQEFKNIVGEPSDNVNLKRDLDTKANKEEVVNKTTDQLIAGTKTFTNHIKIPEGVSIDDGVNFNQLSKKANQGDVVLLKTNQEIIGEKTFFGTAHMDGGLTAKINGEKAIDFVDGIKLIKNDTSTNPQVYQKNAEGLLEPFLAEHVQDIVSLSKLNLELAKVSQTNVDRVIREGTVYITNNDGSNVVCNKWVMTGSQDPNILFKELKDEPQLYKLELDVNVGNGSGLGTFPKMLVSLTDNPFTNAFPMSYEGSEGGQGSIMFTCGTNGIVYPLSGTFNGMITGNFRNHSSLLCRFTEMSSNITFDWQTRTFQIMINGYYVLQTDKTYSNCYIFPNADTVAVAPDTIGLKFRIWKKAVAPQ